MKHLCKIPGNVVRLFLVASVALSSALLVTGGAVCANEVTKPNFVVIFADDLGYGDLSCYGHPTIRTPHLDQLAAEGIRYTQFYVAASVCTPSRAGLMTGRLPVRTGMSSDKRRVLFPNSGGGIPESELTLAEALKAEGYATGCFGKWHLGHLPQFLPTSNGFDTYLGIPYSNDMDKISGADVPKGREIFKDPQSRHFNVPLLKDLAEVERPADQTTITRRYTEAAVEFIKAHQQEPFFVYLPHSLPHVPLFRGKAFEGHSRRGLYGDVIEEIDWSVGQIHKTLAELSLDQKTIVVFTSDNGPWLIFGDHGGTAGLLKDGKGCTYEGGMRVPGIVWGPGLIKSGVISHELASTLDLLPSFVSMAGGTLPEDRIYDGYDLSKHWVEGSPSPREEMYYYRGTRLMAVRHREYKAHYITQAAYGPDSRKPVTQKTPQLYNLDIDPSERFDIAKQQADVLKTIEELVQEHRNQMEIPPSQLEIPLSKE